MIRAAVAGCAGRMGRALVQAIAASDDLRLVAASERPGSPAIGQDAGTVAGVAPLGVPVSVDPDALVSASDCVIDFTTPRATVELAARCAAAGVPLVAGTTGLSAEDGEALAQAARRVPIVAAPNMSVGVNVLLRLASEAVRLLGPGYDLEVVELHHNRKADAPSGTALRLAEVLAQASEGWQEQGTEAASRLCHGRSGMTGPRGAAEIGVHAVRGGDIVGEHTVYCCTSGERLELSHRASSRQTFAGGALRALRWVQGKPPGLYSMLDVLGLAG